MTNFVIEQLRKFVQNPVDRNGMTVRHGVKWLSAVHAMAFATLFLSACTGGKYPAPPVTLPTDSVNQSSYDYIIGEGDLLNIFVWGYEDLSVSLPVRPDGRITTRLVEDLQASGKTPTALARDVEKRYKDFVKRPVVTISVAGFVGSTSQQVKIIGGSTEPKSLPYERGMMLLDALIRTGGLGEFSSGNRALLIRGQGEEQETYSLRLDDLVRKGDISANVQLAPGDIIMIPENWF